MKLTFKNGALFLTLGLTAIALQTACVNEAERVAAEKRCQISKDERYIFGFDGFLDAKKVIFFELTNGKIIKEEIIEGSEYGKSLTPYGFIAYLPLTDAKNNFYYKIVIDDTYSFILSDIKTYVREHKIMGQYKFFCEIKEFKLNGKARFNTYKDYNGLDKKDAVILPVANSKK